MTSFTTETVNARLEKMGRDFIKCVTVSSYSKKDSVFLDTEFGTFTHSVKNVLQKNGQHPERTRRSKAARLRGEKKKPKDISFLKERLRDTEISIVEDTYLGMTQYATFIDREYGEFRAVPRKVLENHQRHPDFTDRRQIARAARLKAQEKWRREGVESPFHNPEVQKKCRNTMNEKFGHPHPGSSADIQKKIQETNLEKYGVEYLLQDPRFRKKCFDISVENGRCSTSKQEQELVDFLKGHGVEGRKRRFWSPQRQKYLELDFVSEEAGIAVEMNGLYFHSERFLDKKYHHDKLKMAQEQGLRLIMIWDWEWKNRRLQVENFLLSAFHKNKVSVGARKTVVEKVGKREAAAFLEENHLQGAVAHREAFGLRYKGELLMLITIGSHHRNSGEVVLSRMCAKSGFTVAGGFSKLCKAALQKYPEISSWVDLRISQGLSYEKCGWEEVSVLGPDYFYTDHRNMFSKQSRRKRAVNTPKEMTEREHAALDGLLRVWDCGKKKYTLKQKTI